jgi:hypothetical protein
MESRQMIDFGTLFTRFLTTEILMVILLMMPVAVFMQLFWRAGSNKPGPEGGPTLAEYIFVRPWLVDAWMVAFACVCAYDTWHSWLIAMAVGVAVACVYLNLAITRASHGSLVNVYKEEGLKKAVLMLFFGIFIVAWELLHILRREFGDDEDEAEDSWS